MFIYLFFYCSGDHRDLHSFPTRRSSDLPDQLAADRAVQPGGHTEPNEARRCPPVVCPAGLRSEEHTSELQSRFDLVCRLLLEKKKEYSTASRTTLACASVAETCTVRGRS